MESGFKVRAAVIPLAVQEQLRVVAVGLQLICGMEVRPTKLMKARCLVEKA